MIRVIKTHSEMKYIGALIVAIIIWQLSTSPDSWKEMLFVGQAIFVEFFLIFVLQVLAGDVRHRIVELRRLCSNMHAVNTRLIRDIVTLKGLLNKPREKHPEKYFEKSNRIVMQTIKNKLLAKHRGKMISQRNKGHRVKPYETKSVNKQCGPIYSEIPEQQYIAMAAAVPTPTVQQEQIATASLNVGSQNCKLGEKPKKSEKSKKAKHDIPGAQKQAIKKWSIGVKERQYFGTRRICKGKVVYERMCLICSNLMRQQGHPIYSKICDTCKPVHGRHLTHYKRLTKFDDLIEFYCGCTECFKVDNPPCLEKYCELCTIPKFTRKVDDELQPLLEEE